MWLTRSEPLLHAPAGKDRAHIISSFIFLERRRCRDIAFTGANFVNLIQSNIRIVQLKTTSETKSLGNRLVKINEHQRRDRLRSESNSDERCDTAFCQ